MVKELAIARRGKYSWLIPHDKDGYGTIYDDRRGTLGDPSPIDEILKWGYWEEVAGPVTEHVSHDQKTHGRRGGSSSAGSAKAKRLSSNLTKKIHRATAEDIAIGLADMRSHLDPEGLDLSGADRFQLGGGMTAPDLLIEEGGAAWVAKDIYGGGVPQFAEVSAYRISEALGLGVVPETKYAVTPKGEAQIAQSFTDGVMGAEFSPGYNGADELVAAIIYDDDRTPESIEATGLLQTALLDTILGNQDRHDRNWLVQESDSAAGGVRVVAIDNGSAMEMNFSGSGQKNMAEAAYRVLHQTNNEQAMQALDNIVTRMPDISREDWAKVVSPQGGDGSPDNRLTEASFARYRTIRAQAGKPILAKSIIKSMMSKKMFQHARTDWTDWARKRNVKLP